VAWVAQTAKLNNIDMYRADYGGLLPSQRQTEPYYFGVLEAFLHGGGGGGGGSGGGDVV
jgi:hypothetical protein